MTAPRIHPRTGRAHVIVTVLDVAELPHRNPSRPLLITARVLGLLRAQYADLLLQRALQILVGVEPRIEQQLLGLRPVEALDLRSQRRLLARRMHLRVHDHARLVGQHRRLVRRAAAAPVLQLQQARLGLRRHHRLRTRALSEHRARLFDLGKLRLHLGVLGPRLGLHSQRRTLRFERLALDQRKARAHRLQHRPVAGQPRAPRARALQHRLRNGLEQRTVQFLLMTQDEAPQDRVIRRDPAAHPHALEIPAREALKLAQRTHAPHQPEQHHPRHQPRGIPREAFGAVARLERAPVLLAQDLAQHQRIAQPHRVQMLIEPLHPFVGHRECPDKSGPTLGGAACGLACSGAAVAFRRGGCRCPRAGNSARGASCRYRSGRRGPCA